MFTTESGRGFSYFFSVFEFGFRVYGVFRWLRVDLVILRGFVLCFLFLVIGIREVRGSFYSYGGTLGSKGI